MYNVYIKSSLDFMEMLYIILTDLINAQRSLTTISDTKVFDT